MDPIRAGNLEHYKNVQQRLLRTYCCGCISSGINGVLICFFWAAISFYFSILAFMQKSPFYSYVQDVPLVAFGAVNLLFGIVSLTSMFIMLIKYIVMREEEKKWRWEQWFMPNPRQVLSIEDSSTAVYAITVTALAVLITTLINFILFIINKDVFTTWCLNESAGYVVNVYTGVNQTLTNTTIINLENALTNATGIYNCGRLYENEVKWSLLCMLIMFIVYVHWILILAAKKTYRLIDPMALAPAGPVPGISEIRNIRPSKHQKLEILKNVKPSKSLWRDLLAHKQYVEFKDGNYERDVDIDHSEVKNKNIIRFEDDLYASKEIIAQPNQVMMSNKDSPLLHSTNSFNTIILPHF